MACLVMKVSISPVIMTYASAVTAVMHSICILATIYWIMQQDASRLYVNRLVDEVSEVNQRCIQMPRFLNGQ
jgi:hypothetical protein